MAKTKKVGGLGQGLQALFPAIPEEDSAGADNGSLMVSIDRIKVNPYQPRDTFDEERLQELSDSIKEHGVLQPVLLRETEQGYELVAGERRVRAAKLAGLTEIPSMVRELSDPEVLEISIIENVQRENLDPVEEARAYKRLSTEFRQTQEQIARKVSKSRSYVANSMRLLQLPPLVLGFLEHGDLTAGHARPLLALQEEDAINLALHMVSTKASVRDAEQWAKEVAKGSYTIYGENAETWFVEKVEHKPIDDTNSTGATKTRKEKKDTALSVELKEIQRILRDTVNTKVEIISNNKGGKIIIDYYSDDDVARILELFLGTREMDG